MAGEHFERGVKSGGGKGRRLDQQGIEGMNRAERQAIGRRQWHAQVVEREVFYFHCDANVRPGIMT